MQNADLAKRHLFSNKVDVDLDVLGAAMLYGVAGHVDSTNIVAEDHSRSRKGMMKFAKKLAYPAAFSNSMSNSPVFRLSTGPGDRSLPFRGPGDQVVTEVDAIAGRRPASVRAPRPIRVRIRGERRRRGTRNMHPEVKSTFDVAENTFHQIEVRVPWRMHVKASLLYGMSDVWTGMREVLESTRIAVILGGISKKDTVFSGELASNIDRCSAWITVNHASALKKLNGVLSLREHHARRSPSNRDAEKVGQVAKISHGELRVEQVNEVAKQLVRRGGDDNVVHI
jgi:hypothetical protein